jgi:hypothetical protein
VAGTPIRFIVASMVVTAVPSEMPGARLNEMVLETSTP